MNMQAKIEKFKEAVEEFNDAKKEVSSEEKEALDQIIKMGKNAVVAVIERRGEITYYKVSKVRFANNKMYPKPMSKTSEE